MPKIITLPQEIIAKTAAGEIIERPASVIKELIDNAIDAGATDISIILENAGLKKIHIVDNGEGMDEPDLRQCYLPHTTSKIHDHADLINISTLGFRGEALASIASVSNFIIKSRQADYDFGCCLIVESNRFISCTPIGMPVGTDVLISNLFSNYPARKKFLKSQQLEYKAILTILLNYIFAYPEVGFSLTHNAKNIFTISADTSLATRINILLGTTIGANLFEVNFSEDGFSLHGYISKPQISSKYRENQYLFVNNRPVRSGLISTSIRNAYGSLLDPKSHPPFILFLETPVGFVDVNIHPRKEEVRFLDDTAVSTIIAQTLAKSFSEIDLTYQKDVQYTDVFTPNKKAAGYLFDKLKDSGAVWYVHPQDISTCSEVLQVDTCYLVVNWKNGLLVLDQHAAHEKILYDQFMEEFFVQKRLAKKISLSQPILLELPLPLQAIMMENQKEFELLGFEIDPFGGSTFKVRAFPELLQGQDIRKLVIELLESFANEGKNLDINTHSQKTIAYLACRTAVKSGDYLSMDERIRLVTKFLESGKNYTCPHGRPAMVEFTLAELARLFKR